MVTDVSLVLNIWPMSDGSREGCIKGSAAAAAATTAAGTVR